MSLRVTYLEELICGGAYFGILQYNKTMIYISYGQHLYYSSTLITLKTMILFLTLSFCLLLPSQFSWCMDQNGEEMGL